jgi:hypothetical protein
MPRARPRSRDAARSKRQPRRWRLRAAAPALLALVLLALSPGETARASAQTTGVIAASGVASQVGQPAPEFTVATLDGLSLTSADLLAQEKPFILYFFAAW